MAERCERRRRRRWLLRPVLLRLCDCLRVTNDGNVEQGRKPCECKRRCCLSKWDASLRCRRPRAPQRRLMLTIKPTAQVLHGHLQISDADTRPCDELNSKSRWQPLVQDSRAATGSHKVAAGC